MKGTKNSHKNLRESHILVKGARMHNLKNLDIAIGRNKLTVITGLSGSGKSSLAFDTLYAEGQRRYVESLSSYARQFLGKIDKPDVDDIVGISPAIAIQQKVNTRNPRSTVGTTTEIYDYLKLLFARIGKTYSPETGELVKRDTITDVVEFILSFPESTRIMIESPVIPGNRTIAGQLQILKQQGFDRIVVNNTVEDIETWLSGEQKESKNVNILIDRVAVQKDDEDFQSRLADSVQTAYYEGHGECFVVVESKKNKASSPKWERHVFNNRFERDGITFESPTVHFFSFNNPVGACKTCEGFGSVIGIDPDLVIPNKSQSIYNEAIVCWKGEKMSEWKNELIRHADKFDFPIHRPYNELTSKQQKLLWTGNEYFGGLNRFFKSLEEQSYKIQYRVMLSRYRGKTPCPECNGTRLRKDAAFVKVNAASIQELLLLPIKELVPWFENLETKLDRHDREVSKRLLIEINNRLKYLSDVGLDYLTLNRLSNSLSGGESQRINLATMLGSSLVGSMYILDEPSIGLHPRDTHRLIRVLKGLRDLGNSVIVVEHDEEIMRDSDEIIDLGPGAGVHGGELVFQGTEKDFEAAKDSLTAAYLTGKKEIEVPAHRRVWKQKLKIEGAHQNNLKNIDVDIPLGVLTVVTGVSGSGKSSLIRDILYPSVQKYLAGHVYLTGNFNAFGGDLAKVEHIEFVDQNPIGKSSRSNPVTYVKAFDDIRALFAKQSLAKVRGFKPSSFSFNVEGGRCENCKGEGNITVEMQFMADVHLMCDACHGKRFITEVLEVTYRNKSIADVLEMTIDEAIDFFKEEQSVQGKRIIAKLQPLQDVGLGYVQLGQSSSTLSGGEAQRIKLGSFLGKGQHGKRTLFVFDEPTTGLHFHDVRKLLKAFDALIAHHHTVVVIEHHADVIKSADWVIDLGPEGGNEGGYVVFTGIPEDLAKCEDSYTGKFLKEKLS